MTVHNINEAFHAFPKIARLARECVVTEKLDGTNGQINIVEFAETPPAESLYTYAIADGYSHKNYAVMAGSRNRWLQPTKGSDNFGFAGWVKDNAAELVKLGPGRHYGEWWGQGIQRGYGLKEKRFSLFNVGRWYDQRLPPLNSGTATAAPSCCGVVPIVYTGSFSSFMGHEPAVMDGLREYGSLASPGFMNPEGIIVYHTAANIMFKCTLEDDEAPKSVVAMKEAA